MTATKILVVDDEPDIEELIKQRFAKQVRSHEMDFVFASDGAKALKTLYHDEQIHVVLTDINMPEMDGLALLSHLQGFDRILKTVIISAYGDMSNIRKAMNCGAADFITKPIDFKELETTIVHAVEQCSSLEKTLEGEREFLRLEKEWAIARDMQESVIPRRFDPLPGMSSLDIYGTVLPAPIPGGDFIDFFSLDAHHLGLVIADIAGKSVPAVFFMAMSRLAIRAAAQNASSPAECLIEANRILSIDSDNHLFSRVFYAIYDSRTGVVDYANAGHPPPLLLKANQTPSWLACEEGIPLGIHYPHHYNGSQFLLTEGDSLVLCSDGLLQSQDATGQEYGRERLLRDMEGFTHSLSVDLISHLLDGLAQFSRGAPRLDDVALLCLRRLGSEPVLSGV